MNEDFPCQKMIYNSLWCNNVIKKICESEEKQLTLDVIIIA